MDVLFPDAGLLYILKQTVGTGLIYDLYINDYTPNLGSVLGNFTRANWSGYSPVFVPASSWTVQSVGAHIAQLAAMPIIFLNPSGAVVKVYGFYVKDSTNTVLVAAGRFDLAPISIPVSGGFPLDPTLGTYSGLAS